jgi:hypothetical protein
VGHQDGQEADGACTQGERRLRRQQRDEHRIPTGVAQAFLHVGQRPQAALAHGAVARLLHGTPNGGHQQRGGRERGGVSDEGRFPTEHRGERAADRRAEGEHRAPGGAEQRRGLLELLGVAGEVRDGGLGGGHDEGAERGDRRLRHEGQPEATGPDGQQRERGRHLHGRNGDDDPAAVEAVSGGAGHRGHEKPRQRLGDEHQGHQEAGSAEVVDQPEQGHVAEPVAQVRDDLGDEERS